MSSSMLLFLVCLFGFVLDGSLAVRAQGAADGRQELVLVREEGLEVQARQLEQMYPEVRRNLESALGWELRRPPQVVLTADRETFEKMSGSPLVSAIAVPRQQTIVMLLSAATSTSVMRETLEHELCHLVLHDHISQKRLPKWLDEGICQWVSGSLGEILAGQGLVTAGINLSRHPIPLEQLAESFPGEKRLLVQAYEESRLFVDFLVARYGKNGLIRLLEHLKEGEAVDDAALKAFSSSLESLQTEWLRELQDRNLWLLWFSQYLYEILFFLAALLTVLAAVRLMIRKRTYDPDDEEEEEEEEE
jgi:hypothetical protein